MATNRAELQETFAERMRELTAAYLPRGLFCDWFGLGLGAVRDLEQGRVLPSRATVVLMHAIEQDPDFMRQVAKAAKADLKALEAARVRSHGDVKETAENG
jgi:DNA-binding transcriptional regulator YiaG